MGEGVELEKGDTCAVTRGPSSAKVAMPPVGHGDGDAVREGVQAREGRSRAPTSDRAIEMGKDEASHEVLLESPLPITYWSRPV